MLPFIQAPPKQTTHQCGNSQSGIIEMPVLGGLTIGESALIDSLLIMEQSEFTKASQVADAIAKEESARLGREFSLTEAFQLVRKAVAGQELEPQAEEIRIRHAVKIESVARAFADAGIRTMEATVTALVNKRLDLPNWGLDDTRKMHRVLFNDIWDLAQTEHAAEQMPVNPPTEDDLKKPQPGVATGSKRRGTKSSGT
jgi:hypothetical protein